MESRIYGKKIDIDPERVNGFFEERSRQSTGLASVMLRPHAKDGIAEKRNSREKELVLKLLGDRSGLRVLDLGCGAGRWADNLEGKYRTYRGLDFTQSYIAAAKKAHAGKSGCFFFNCPVTSPAPEILSDRYELIILNGLCMYLNDKDLDMLFTYLPRLLSPGAGLYVRESISTLDSRLTLKDFFSDELQSAYNAIYRTGEEYELLFANRLPGCAITSCHCLLDASTGARPETNQKYWWLESEK